MQMLRISNERRARLRADGLLAINAKSQEVLHGLTFEESQFLIDFGEETPGDTPMPERLAEFALRHEQARLRIAMADDESSADEEHRLRTATRF
ncbi:hypothetical protein J2W35_006846 [Variovorax boronicumulans]|uniref:hypothetical protein n=1 Tax=Variovorax boronicumulans TaxID=436515 RepID=UPI002786923A|nr:hypothetical protein [Variovorax boronicumulans]MDQ0086464.1 hypothetical protein [Variovorax boronicumulans]